MMANAEDPAPQRQSMTKVNGIWSAVALHHRFGKASWMLTQTSEGLATVELHQVVRGLQVDQVILELVIVVDVV